MHARNTSTSAGNSNISSANIVTPVTILEQDWENGPQAEQGRRCNKVLYYNKIGHIDPEPFESPPSKSRLCIHCTLTSLIQTLNQPMSRTQIMTPGTAPGSHHAVGQQQPPELVHFWGTTVGWHLRNLVYICQGSFVTSTMQEYFINIAQSASFDDPSHFSLLSI